MHTSHSELKTRKPALIAVILALLPLSLLTACSDDNPPDCGFTIDQVEQISEQQGFFFYRRVSGWSDKVESIEVYKEQPQFDRCHAPVTKPLLVDTPDSEDPIKSVTYSVTSNSMTFEQTPTKIENITVNVVK